MSGRAAPPPPEKDSSYYLILTVEASARLQVEMGNGEDRDRVQRAVQQRGAEIRATQGRLESVLAGRGVKVTGKFHRLANAVRVLATTRQIAEWRSWPGVVRVEPVTRYDRLRGTSVPFIGAPPVWRGATGANADGQGIRIGIIDSGIDYLHADFGGSGRVSDYDFNNPDVIEPGTFPTAKVAGGFDFAGDDYDGTSDPVPDPDPLDCFFNGHGTHVAGIAAGMGVLTNGQTYTGTYATNLDLRQFYIGPGVAPRAQLFALKVFGCFGSTELVLEALEWAADPNGDGQFNDRLDVVNLSLGSAFGLAGPRNPDQDAINLLADLGCVVVVAAGNEGNTQYIVASPAVAEKAIAVANSIDAPINPAVEVLTPPSIVGRYEAIEGAFTRPLAQTGTLQGRVVAAVPIDGCAPLSNGAAVNGNVVLMDRGTCLFVDKVREAQSRGARAVLMVNNVPDPPFIMGGVAPDVVIPGVMISQADGNLLKSQLAANLTVRLGTNILYPVTLADRMVESSSRGPAAMGNWLKPDLAAPGLDIFSADVGSGVDRIENTGTSMSSPHVAGAAALLRQLHPTWPVAEIKAALMNTCRPTRDGAGLAYPESMTGAGRVQVDLAARTAVTVKTELNPGQVSLSYGSLVLTGLFSQVRYVVITNHGTISATFDVAVTNTVTEAGLTMEPLTNQVIVPGRGSRRLGVRLSAQPALFDRTGDGVSPAVLEGRPRSFLYEVSGEVWLLHTNVSLHVPFYANVRAAASLHSARAVVPVPPGSPAVEVELPMAGVSAHPSPLVSVFQLGLVSSNMLATNPAVAVGDLLAVGAASDVPSRAAFQDGILYFGLATAGDWPAPQTFLAQLEVRIDVNRDGQDDYRLLNTSAGNFTGDAFGLADPDLANDAFLVVMQNLSNGSVVTNRVASLNVFPPAQDTVPFNNSVMVMPLPVQSVGLTAADPVIQYRVQTFGSAQRSHPMVETTPYVSFNAARPVVDSTRYGIMSTPFHADGSAIRLRVERGAGPSTNVLLLHHHNPNPTQRLDIVSLDLNALFITSVARETSLVRVRFNSAPGVSYQLERTPTLSPLGWEAVGNPLSGTGGTLEAIDATVAGVGSRFYRVRAGP